jgi:hypothetical protein
MQAVGRAKKAPPDKRAAQSDIAEREQGRPGEQDADLHQG